VEVLRQVGFFRQCLEIRVALLEERLTKPETGRRCCHCYRNAVMHVTAKALSNAAFGVYTPANLH
jgi:hypothetical protein